ncbi:MAG TPA: family 1 glycosylhydrolase [Vicinamibacterales bacterium]|nr:family 1 glycosylhydrolase [Vicinamibacterales bacterium]
MSDAVGRRAIESWGGVECTLNRVGDRSFDQLAWSGHDRRDDDLERFAALGITAIRYPVLWERLAPDGTDGIDWRWTDRRLATLRALGIRPIIGLVHHGSGPASTSLLDPAFPERLANYARAVAERYHWVADFTPVNEPLTTARFSALYGHWYPHARSDAAFVRALTNQARATVLAMRAIREVVPAARLIQTEDCGGVFGTAATVHQVAFENHRRWLTWDLLTGAVTADHPLYRYLRRAGFTDDDRTFFTEHVCRLDVLGVNYYLTSDRYLDDRIASYPAATHGGNGALRYADVEAVRARPEGIVGHAAHLIDAWERYQIPVALTEVHLACTREEQMRWLKEAWSGSRLAQSCGADVRAVTSWALLGSYNWNSLVTVDGNDYEPGAFDVRGAVPRPTAVARLTAAESAGLSASHPVLNAPGWWRRPDRLTFARPDAAVLATSGSPLLVIGATGTLGHAFERICARRGLSVRIVGRRDVDITDRTSIIDTIQRVQPWAVVNAAGYVRVDDAEREPDLCRSVNADGAAYLADACRLTGRPLLTYSSDLVFDGTKGSPYDEGDATAPLGVYGASKAEAERRVLALLPAALVIRTSAFFGPWDEHNFLAALFAALDRGRPFQAASDEIVSPTYVPDLVDASLDLLIDAERGIWHLANAGAISWYDFAMLAAAHSDRRLDLIEPTEGGAREGSAVRPRFSALGTRRGQLLRPLDAALSSFLHDVREREPERHGVA